jgi:hypothetical protein
MPTDQQVLKRLLDDLLVALDDNMKEPRKARKHARLPRISGQSTWRLTGPLGVEQEMMSGCIRLRVLLDALVAGLGTGLLATVVTAPYVLDGQLV